MKKILLVSLFVLVGCNKHKDEGNKVAVLHGDGYVVPATNTPDIPQGYKAISGNIDLIPVLMGFEASEVRVYLKASEIEPWNKIQVLQKGQTQPGYTLDSLNHQLRFQNCLEGWAYFVGYK